MAVLGVNLTMLNVRFYVHVDQVNQGICTLTGHVEQDNMASKVMTHAQTLQTACVHSL